MGLVADLAGVVATGDTGGAGPGFCEAEDGSGVREAVVATCGDVVPELWRVRGPVTDFAAVLAAGDASGAGAGLGDGDGGWAAPAAEDAACTDVAAEV